eukprot:gnl/TRDRNA2_/TRDRNA2_191520_c0_seq1.p1 gnl/TRDRNA2_/TRDRNA2_191520_c0~~gnl/TRDRNA2_/TRDRNA2_191520_c0_seq1.p1  ORF type:complete len:195 (+),score=31.93 gnl/TRDRNA2_/TRDRNA2_191520_c0_seq1:96-680(+)
MGKLPLGGLQWAAGVPDEGFAGGLTGGPAMGTPGCRLRHDPSPADPATFESYVKLLEQGSGGVARTAAAARLLQREATDAHIYAQGAIKALQAAADDGWFEGRGANLEPLPGPPLYTGEGAEVVNTYVPPQTVGASQLAMTTPPVSWKLAQVLPDSTHGSILLALAGRDKQVTGSSLPTLRRQWQSVSAGAVFL